MQEWADISAINAALKSLCREFGVERDRQSVLQIATVLMRLSKQEVRNAEDLAKCAREQLYDTFNPLDVSGLEATSTS